jgi:hypothetical protein
MTELSLIQKAAAERRYLGYLTDATRAALTAAGYTAAEIESALNKQGSNHG